MDKKEVTITRTEVIVVNLIEHNDYGDMIFTDMAGESHKIGEKRAKFFTDTIIKGKASQLSYAVGYGKEYVYSAKLVEGELPPSVKVTTTPVPEPSKVDTGKTTASPVPRVIAPQERGMWWKQLGDDLRSGHIDASKSSGKAIRLLYFAEMFSVLDINIEQNLEEAEEDKP